MKKTIFAFCGLLLFLQNLAFAQTTKPQVVVGIVIDQMRYDYFLRYEKLYGENGFKRLLREGFSCENAHFNYYPTVTAAGHASIYTGSVPRYHGIIENYWFDKSNEKPMYCVEDKDAKPITGSPEVNNRSPKNLQCPTFSDELRYTFPNAKAIGVSIKDRGAILPAGRAATWAFWYDYEEGNFTSSAYYGSKLPEWLSKFNTVNRPEKLLEKGWDLLFPKSKYNLQIFDKNPYEELIGTAQPPAFPYTYDLKSNSVNKELLYTPFANTLLTDLAMETMKQEKIGKRGETDFFSVSYSSTDIIGHAYGTHSYELADCYARMDRDLERFLNFLDKEYGAENYLLFLTSDHAVAENPAYLKDNFKSDAEAFSAGIVRSRIDSALSVKFGQGQWVAYTNGEQIWFNEKELREKNMTTEVAAKEAKKFLMTLDPVYAVFTKEELENQAHEEKFAKMAFASAHPKSAPDLYTVYKPQFINSSSPRGTTHGSPYAYDTQAPLVFFGQNIPKGKKTVKRVEITDIVPTLCLLLRLQFPACVTGEPIEPIFEK